MKEKIVKELDNRFDELNIFIDDVFIVNENNEKLLTIVLDSKNMIDLKTVVKATRILNPIVDKLGLSKDIDTLDVYAKEKGSDINE